MSSRKQLEELFFKHGFTDFKWIDPQNIVISQWVRMKCMFGCKEYGKNACCPPNTLPVQECRSFFREYSQSVVFHFEKKFKKPEQRHEWTKGINDKLLSLEREVFWAGNPKAFLLFAGLPVAFAQTAPRKGSNVKTKGPHAQLLRQWPLTFSQPSKPSTILSKSWRTIRRR